MFEEKKYRYILKNLIIALILFKKDYARDLASQNYGIGKTKIIRTGLPSDKKLKENVIIEIKICE